MPPLFRCLRSLLVLIPLGLPLAGAAASDALDRYNVVWDSPSSDSSGSMPLGNGDIALNAWVEPSGDLLFYVAKSDAWTSINRLVKLGRIRVSLTPNPLAAGWAMEQSLVLRDGAITVSFTKGDKRVDARLWVDAHRPVVRLDTVSSVPVALTATFESSRPKARGIGGDEAISAQGTWRGGRDEDATVVVPDATDSVVWYDRNERSWYPFNLAGQSLEKFPEQNDPLLHRTFGALMRGPGFRTVNATTLRAAPAVRQSLSITVLTAQTPAVETWRTRLEKLAASAAAVPAADAWTANQAWWAAFWDRSFIRFTTPEKNTAGRGAATGHDAALLIGAGRSGRDAETFSTFQGDIARVRINDRVLDPTELLRRAASPSVTVPADAGVVADWVFTQVAPSYRPVAGNPALVATLVGEARPAADGAGITLGKDSRLEVASAPTIELTGAHTVEAWIRADAKGGGSFLNKSRPKGSRAERFNVHLDRDWREIHLLAGHTITNTNSPFPSGTWTHVAVDYDAATGARTVYVNGRPLAYGPPTYTTDRLAQQWHLQRFVIACAGRGDAPIKFNGSLFTFDTGRFNADYRRWGGGYWFQNTRLIYWPLLATGDHEMMRPLFEMFRRSLPLATYRAKHYYGLEDAAFWPETQTFFGTYTDHDYGKDRKPGDPANIWIRRYYSGNLELVALMLDYWAHTRDEAFARDTLLPIATRVINFYENYATTRDEQGNLKFYPAQALETHQNALNPANEIAGLRWVLPLLARLPDDLVTPAQREHWTQLLARTPALPRRQEKSGEVLAAFEKTFAPPHNSENPELYAVFPFRLFGLGGSPEDLAVARRTFARRANTGAASWQQNDIQAALLGLTDEAAKMIQSRANGATYRFPAFWNRANDWMPDQCSASNFFHAVSLMALHETPDGKIRVLPAWPKDWPVHLKLHASDRTIVELRTDFTGKITNLQVTPESARSRLVLP